MEQAFLAKLNALKALASQPRKQNEEMGSYIDRVLNSVNGFTQLKYSSNPENKSLPKDKYNFADENKQPTAPSVVSPVLKVK